MIVVPIDWRNQLGKEKLEVLAVDKKHFTEKVTSSTNKK
jgi:hypothetical protein